MNIGYFISSHGFGHAARACAIIEKLSLINNNKIFIFTETPKWFFENSLKSDFEYFSIQTDVGLVQENPFVEDLEKTLIELDKFFPFKEEINQKIESILLNNKINLIISDISPLGVFLASRLKIDSILIENFTWDWVYTFYLENYPALKKYIDAFEEIYKMAKFHFTCEPYCNPTARSILTAPIFREPRQPKELILNQLSCSPDDNLILISMGGIPIEKLEYEKYRSKSNYKFIFPVRNVSQIQHIGSIIYLPHNHTFFHPDLVNVSKLVVGKVGYSTITEVSSMKKPFMYVGRKKFPESEILETYIKSHSISDSFEFEELFSETWYLKVTDMLDQQNNFEVPDSGANQINSFIMNNYYK
ncbi:MAG TPA: glycosyltransferase family protein [Anaerolineaceae bacterium]|nr:glycosyltransferase family protein [Anaerolineaceae bacterium]